jgi:uncharacterized protein (TIGR03067 family)
MKRFLINVSLVLAALCCLEPPWPAVRPAASAQEKIDKAEAVKKELAALQGTWKLVTHEEGGKDVPYAEGEAPRYIFDKDKLTFKVKDEVIAEGPIDLDPTRSPKHMELRLTSGQTDLTIYIRVGDYLIQCGHRDGKTRPSEFATGTPNGGAYLVILKREK